VLPSACTVAVAGLVHRIQATTTHPLAPLLEFLLREGSIRRRGETYYRQAVGNASDGLQEG
jgi:hypothetical protein